MKDGVLEQDNFDSSPAIGNAIFNAVGARVRGLPITSDSVKEAMKKAT